MLELYRNIKRLRKQHHMSQQELAEAVGYKGKSMIAQIENGRVNLPSSMIEKFAEVFNVSALELMGIDEDSDPDAIRDQILDTFVQNSDDATLLSLYHQASEKDRLMVDYILGFSKIKGEIDNLNDGNK